MATQTRSLPGRRSLDEYPLSVQSDAKVIRQIDSMLAEQGSSHSHSSGHPGDLSGSAYAIDHKRRLGTPGHLLLWLASIVTIRRRMLDRMSDVSVVHSSALAGLERD